jgi:hypothetical protein
LNKRKRHRQPVRLLKETLQTMRNILRWIRESRGRRAQTHKTKKALMRHHDNSGGWQSWLHPPFHAELLNFYKYDIILSVFLRRLEKAPTFLVPIINPPFASSRHPHGVPFVPPFCIKPCKQCKPLEQYTMPQISVTN